MINLLLNVIERIWGVYCKADKDDMGIRIAERTQAVVVFLACSIPQRKLDVFAIHFDIGHVVLEYRWNINLESKDEECRKGEGCCGVYLWERAFGKDNQETGLKEI